MYIMGRSQLQFLANDSSVDPLFTQVLRNAVKDSTFAFVGTYIERVGGTDSAGQTHPPVYIHSEHTLFFEKQNGTFYNQNVTLYRGKENPTTHVFDNWETIPGAPAQFPYRIIAYTPITMNRMVDAGYAIQRGPLVAIGPNGKAKKAGGLLFHATDEGAIYCFNAIKNIWEKVAYTPAQTDALILAEKERAELAEEALGLRIDKEIEDREKADTALGERIDEEIEDREEADDELRALIEDEETRATAAENDRQKTVDVLLPTASPSTQYAIMKGGGISPIIGGTEGMPVGIIVGWPDFVPDSKVLPAGKWLKCDGLQQLLVASYPDLFDLIGHAYDRPTDNDPSVFRLPTISNMVIRVEP